VTGFKGPGTKFRPKDFFYGLEIADGKFTLLSTLVEYKNGSWGVVSTSRSIGGFWGGLWDLSWVHIL